MATTFFRGLEHFTMCFAAQVVKQIVRRYVSEAGIEVSFHENNFALGTRKLLILMILLIK